jgi:hypothetical protein
MDEPKREAASSPAPGPASLTETPVFYRQPRPLEPVRYAGKSLREMTDFNFARASNSVPVNGVEFPPAMRNYPLVFTVSQPLAALAVLGLRDRENLFVEADGSWRADCYVPAYVRRYPFIFTQSPKGDQLILCIDDASDLLVEDASRPLFVNNAPSPVVGRGLAFCGEYQGQYNATQEFVAALEKHEILVHSQVQFALEPGRSVSLGGFRVVDEGKLNALPDPVFMEWRKRGWIPMIYCHLLSLSNWQRLAQLAGSGPQRSAL